MKKYEILITCTISNHVRVFIVDGDRYHHIIASGIGIEEVLEKTKTFAKASLRHKMPR